MGGGGVEDLAEDLGVAELDEVTAPGAAPAGYQRVRKYCWVVAFLESAKLVPDEVDAVLVIERSRGWESVYRHSHQIEVCLWGSARKYKKWITEPARAE